MARVFVSYATKDHAVADEVCGWLREEQHQVFVDHDVSDGIDIGERWKQRLYRELRAADAVVCIVTEAYTKAPWCAAEIGFADSVGCRLLPLQAEPGVVFKLLGTLQHVDMRGDWRERIRKTLRRASGGWDRARSPFPGLRPFDGDMAAVFHGRKEETRQLTARLRVLGGRSDGGLLLLAGPSGCGKSSLVRAGLVGAMKQEPGWQVVDPFAPGSDPVGALAQKLTTAADELRLGWTVARTLAMLDDHNGLRVAAAELLVVGKGERLLLMIDQGEELLTRSGTESRERFTALVAKAVNGPVRVVVALRSEFQDQLLSLPELEHVGTDVVPLRPLSQEMLRVVIEEPARIGGLEIDPELVTRLVADTGTGDALPLLAFTLEQLAESTLSAAEYTDRGGVRGVLIRHADAALARAVAASGASDHQVLDVLMRLASFDTTRRRVDLDGLDEPLRVAIGVFVDERLLTKEHNWVEVAHEALLTAWPPLEAAISEHKVTLLTARSLELATADWQEAGKPDHLLWDADQLAAARNVDAIGPTKAFLEASQHKVRETALRERRRRTRVVAALTALVVLLAAATVFAGFQWNNAGDSRRVAVGRSLQAQARESDAGTSLRLGIAAMSIDSSAEARAGLVRTLMGNRYLATLTGHGEDVSAVAFSPDGRLMATGSRYPSVILWDVSDPAHPRRLHDIALDDAIWTIVFSKDGHTMVTGGPGGTVQLWDVSDRLAPRRLGTMSEAPRWVSSAALSQDGRTLITGIWDNSGPQDDKAILWDVSDRTSPRKLATLTVPGSGPVRGVGISHDGRVAITGDEMGAVHVWDVASGARLTMLTEHRNSVWTVALSPDGRTMLTGGADQTAIVWDFTNPAQPVRLSRLTGHTGTVRAATFSPDGRTVATGSGDHTAILWDVEDLSRPVRLDTLGGHSQPVFALAFGGGGDLVATASSDRTAVLWDRNVAAYPKRLSDLPGGSAGQSSMAFSPDGTRMATGGPDGTMITWDVGDPARPRRLGAVTAHQGAVFTVAVSPDGRRLITGGTDYTAALWDVSDWTRPHRLAVLTGHRGTITAVSFAPDGRTVATGSDDARTMLWDVTDPVRPLRLSTLTGQRWTTRAVPFSPDGRTLITGNTDATTIVWDVTDLRAPRKLTSLTDDNSVYAGVFSPDGRTLALAEEGRKTTLWDMSDREAPQRLATMRGQASSVYTAGFSPDGKVLGTGGYDKAAILWDVTDLRSPRELVSLHGHPTGVGLVVFNPAGRTVAISAGDAPVLMDVTRLTDIVSRPVEVACGIVGEGLTREQWQTYAPDLPHRRTC